MTGMAVNIHLWRHLLHRVEFDCAVDHRAIPYIMKAKTLPATTRMMRLLEILSGYVFNLYFIKGKDMKICDFLSRLDVDRGNPGEVITISFNFFSMLNTIRKATPHKANKLLVATRSKTKAEGTSPPPVHGVQKHLDPALKPEHDKPVVDQNKQRGLISADAKPRVLLRPKLPASQVARKRLIDRSIKLLNKPKSLNVPGRTPHLPDQESAVQKGPSLPNQRPVAQKEPPQRQSNGNTDNTNLPEIADFEIHPVLEEMIPDGSLIHKHLPKQIDIEKILIQINRKYLRKMHLPCSLRDMQAAYMQSPHFCDIYNVIMFNRYPKHRKAIEKLQQAMLSQYVVQGGLLYTYMKNNFGEQEPILCVPPSKIDIFLDQYHISLLGGHSGFTKCFQTLKQRIYFPNLPYYVRLYTISCHICQLFKGSLGHETYASIKVSLQIHLSVIM